jgi:phosphoacetylglucosamine mutase
VAKAFKQALGPRATITGSVTVDCANGVGGPKLREMIKYLPTAANGGIDIKIVNDDVVNPEALNVQVFMIIHEFVHFDIILTLG